MAVALDELVGPLKVSLNAPGSSLFSAEDEEWVERLGTAFWDARLRAFFTAWRLDGNDDIVHVSDGEDMPRETQQLVVIMASLSAIESKLLEMDTTFRAVSGDQEFEVRKSAEVLRELLKQKRADLENLRVMLVDKPASATAVYAIDAVLSRVGTMSDSHTWLGA